MRLTAERLAVPNDLYPGISLELSDHELICRANAGDARCLNHLFQRHRARLYDSVTSIVRSAAIADDIVQDAFVKALCNLDRFRGESEFFTWLFRIAMNCRRPYLSARHKTVSLDDHHPPAEKSAASDGSPDRVLELAERREMVIEALERIEPHHRSILVLREYERFDYQTIAHVLHIKLGTVRSRLSRARIRLRRELKEVT